MGTFKEVPLYVDTRNLSGPQSMKINSMLKSLYNEIDARGIQKKETAPKKGENPTTAWSTRLLDIVSREYDGMAQIRIPEGGLDLSRMTANLDYDIVSLDESYSYLVFDGYTDIDATESITKVGYFFVNGRMIRFHCTHTTEDFVFAGATITLWK